MEKVYTGGSTIGILDDANMKAITIKEKVNAVYTTINLLIYWIGVATLATTAYFTFTGKFDVSVYWLSNNQWKNIDIIAADSGTVAKSSKH